jgi:hypothetical protein
MAKQRAKEAAAKENKEKAMQKRNATAAAQATGPTPKMKNGTSKANEPSANGSHKQKEPQKEGSVSVGAPTTEVATVPAVADESSPPLLWGTKIACKKHGTCFFALQPVDKDTPDKSVVVCSGGLEGCANDSKHRYCCPGRNGKDKHVVDVCDSCIQVARSIGCYEHKTKTNRFEGLTKGKKSFQWYCDEGEMFSSAHCGKGCTGCGTTEYIKMDPASKKVCWYCLPCRHDWEDDEDDNTNVVKLCYTCYIREEPPDDHGSRRSRRH